ncbi:hypothetical protein F5Y03DRAFT_403249 [Xylaria venustula]|nr:hypothetical protein F5Y03DRAFT_403249 [Xylaria venustula]
MGMRATRLKMIQNFPRTAQQLSLNHLNGIPPTSQGQSYPFTNTPSNYRDTNAFKWYKDGEPGNLRRHACPPFNTDGQGRILLAAGERYCRYAEDDGQTLCFLRKRFSSTGALKKYIRAAHQAECAESHPGGLSSRDDQLTARYWQNIFDLANGTVAEPQTPRKAKAVVKDSALRRVPYITREDGHRVLNVAAMKANAGMATGDTCSGCAS